MVTEEKLFSLLDSTAGGQGITGNQFQQLFASCAFCKHIFTRKAASHHIHCEAESERDI
jgi:hypothetical protein